MAHVVAIIAFLFSYFWGFRIALSGPVDHDLFGYAMLFGLAFAVPALIFAGSFYLLFILIRWWATVLISLAAVGVYFFKTGIHSEGWNMALAVLIATAIHQLALLILQEEKRPVRK